MTLFPAILLMLAYAAFSAPASLALRLAPQFGGENRQDLPSTLSLTNSRGQAFSVTRLDFLLSHAEVRTLGGQWLNATNEALYFSAGAGRFEATLEGVPDQPFDRIRFRVGL